MAFVKKVWKDRIAEYINRRLITKEDGTQELVTVARNEGNISQEGDAFNAANMNDLEERIANEFQVLNEGSKWKFIESQKTTSNYILTSHIPSDITELFVIINVPSDNAAGSYLNFEWRILVGAYGLYVSGYYYNDQYKASIACSYDADKIIISNNWTNIIGAGNVVDFSGKCTVSVYAR